MMQPCVNEILKPLKPFQRRTVDHAFQRLFVDGDSTSRFLVADEVGLGKTLVARGIIARAIDHLWDDVSRIDVVYICSNAGIARANLPKLRMDGASEPSSALVTRLTMLATELTPREGCPSFLESKLNFFSFTPGTSLNMGYSLGKRQERELLFHLLKSHVDRCTGLMNLLQGGVKDKVGWRSGLETELPIEPSIQKMFDDTLERCDELCGKLEELVGGQFRRYRQDWPCEAKYARNELIGKLRRLLAEICARVLEPDLLILDEFQRFKPLIETREEHRSPAAELAQSLFSANAHDGRPVRTLLLSATPYKLYTTDAEIGQEDHYEDFLATTRFLFGGQESRVKNLTDQFARFGLALKRAAEGDAASLEAGDGAKKEIERTLRAIMARTERVAATEERDAMVKEPEPPSPVPLMPMDVRQYVAADALFRAVGDRDPMRLWKSAPYLTHFMHGYKFNESLDETLDLSPDKVAEVLRAHPRAFLTAETLHNWSELDPAHAKLRDMVHDLLDRGLWRLLWLPPTLPYWPPGGPFRDKAETTKTLLFSAWNVVPDAVSAILSYEAERRMAGGRIDAYEDPAGQRRPALQLRRAVSGDLASRRLLLLLMPCVSLADKAHPLGAPPGFCRRAWVRKRIEDLLSASGLPNPDNGPVDRRWEWAAPLVLDPALCPFLQKWRDDRLHALSDDEKLPKPNPELFGAYVNELLDLSPDGLGRRPPDLVDLLTDVALGSPAILALRSLKAAAGIDEETRRRLAVTIADAFWSLFNQPAVIALLRQLAAERGASGEGMAYWRLVLRYCRDGNLQAVLDEQWHLLWEQQAWSQEMGVTAVAAECARAIVEVVRPIRSRVHARFLSVGDDKPVDQKEIRIRTAFALRFGRLSTENDEHISQDAVRAAFNSPFRPFVLASTSIGQEGLDFHPWCHRLVHWNLPGNPVDLVQREGRVHRYKGHAVRRNVAAAHGEAAFESWELGKDLWTLVFESADRKAREDRAHDLVPCWIALGDCHVERHVPLLPYAGEKEAFERLKRQLALFHLVLGQPCQEELLTLLSQAKMPVEQLQDLTLDLSPPCATPPE